MSKSMILQTRLFNEDVEKISADFFFCFAAGGLMLRKLCLRLLKICCFARFLPVLRLYFSNPFQCWFLVVDRILPNVCKFVILDAGRYQKCCRCMGVVATNSVGGSTSGLESPGFFQSGLFWRGITPSERYSLISCTVVYKLWTVMLSVVYCIVPRHVCMCAVIKYAELTDCVHPIVGCK